MERTVKVTGTGRLSLTPDTVRIRIELADREKEYTAVVEKSAAHSKEIRKTFEKLGFQKDDLKTQSFHVEQEYESYQDPKSHNWKQRFLGFKACHSLKIEFPRDEKLLGKVLYQVAHLSGEPEFQVEYIVKDPESARQELLKKAVADAREKAEVLAAAGGVALGEILDIQYTFGVVEFTERPMSRGLLAKNSMDAVNESISFDITPDDIKVDDHVTVIWSIR